MVLKLGKLWFWIWILVCLSGNGSGLVLFCGYGVKMVGGEGI